MSNPSPYKSIDIFTVSKKLVLAAYALSQHLPPEEKTNLSHYLRNAALKAHLAMAQGAFMKKGKGKQKLLAQAKNCFLIIDAIVDILIEVGFAKEDQVAEVMELSTACYQHVTGFENEN
jgi:hypothetical protein